MPIFSSEWVILLRLPFYFRYFCSSEIQEIEVVKHWNSVTVFHSVTLLYSFEGRTEHCNQKIKYCKNLRKHIMVGTYPYKYLIKDLFSLVGGEQTVQPQKPKQNLNQGQQDNLYKIPFPNPNKLQLIYR